MNMYNFPDHPEIQWIERTGYPSWMQEGYEEDEEDGGNGNA